MDEQLIPVLRVANAEKAVEWYAKLDFRKEWEHRFEPHLPAFICIVRGNVRLYLSEHQGDGQRGALVYLWIRDVDAVAKEFGVAVHEQPWAREVKLNDVDGNRLLIGTAKTATQ